MNKIFKISFVLLVVFFIGSVLANPISVQADDDSPVVIHLDIETTNGNIFHNDVTVSACTTPNNSTPTVNGFCIFNSASISVDATWFPFGALINSINGVSDPNNFWLWFLNGDAAQVGIDSYILKDGDTILWTLGVQPLKVAVSNTTPIIGEPVTVTVKGFDTNVFDFVPVAGATLEGLSTTTEADGTAIITPSSSGPISFTVSANGFIISNTTTITPLETKDINLKIYSGNTVLFNGPKNISACAESPEGDAPITVNGKCAVEQSGLSNSWTWYDDNFHTISDLPKTLGVLDELGGSASDNINFIYWGWFSDLNYGTVALNKHLLSDNEELLLTYNSYPLRIKASKDSGTIGEEIIFTAEEKSSFSADFSDMVWTPSAGTVVTLGSQTCITTADGTCPIVLSTIGSLHAVASKTLYVPSSAVDIEVSVNNGGGGENNAQSFSSADAISYLKSVQNANGSFNNSDLYTDWAAIAYSAMNVTGSARNNLIAYLKSNNDIGSLLTDNERRAMALLALGQNPYSFNGVDYISAITEEFDGTQLGDVHLNNDDIFGLIVLSKAGYKENEEIISKTISFVLSAQTANGSWDNSPDMTAAAIEALSSFGSGSGAISKAKTYLENSQHSDGGWGNIFSTSWVMQAENTLGTSWIKNGKTGLNYLAKHQAEANNNGSVLSSNETLENNIWATSYAIPAALGKPWSEIMRSVSRPKTASDVNNSNSDGSENESTTTPAPAPETLLVQAVPDSVPTQNKKNPTVKESIPEEASVNADMAEEINSNTLTATAVNSFPDKKSSGNLPIVIITISGLALLYAGLKFWKVL